MFEDSTFESTGSIRTRSRRWMFAAFLFNGSILALLILIPLINPSALPRQTSILLMEAPAPPAPPDQPAPMHPAAAAQGASPFTPITLLPPTLHPVGIPQAGDNPPATTGGGDFTGFDPGPGIPGGTGRVSTGPRNPPNVQLVHPGPARLPSSMVEGMLIHKTLPIYPSIGIAIRQQGTVVLQATISKTGTIVNLHVLSGPPIFQQAAIDAVKTWQYKPYLLNGQPVEVETTVNVVFTLN